MNLGHFAHDDEDDITQDPAPGKAGMDSAERRGDAGEPDTDPDESLLAGSAGRDVPDDEDEPLAATAADPDAAVPRAAGTSGEYTDGPLLADGDGLRANWQNLQAGFIDDPRGTVEEAAGLVEHASQVLVGALRQRQQQLRVMWDGTGSRNGSAAAVSVADNTEQFRLLMQRYRSLFNQICRL